jgi:hypothetical protein
MGIHVDNSNRKNISNNNKINKHIYIWIVTIIIIIRNKIMITVILTYDIMFIIVNYIFITT